MKIRNITVGIVVVGVIFAGGVAAVAWQKGWSIRETVELGAGVIAAKATRHTIADRTAAILAKKPQLRGVTKSAGGKLRILFFKNERSVEVHAPGWKAPRIYPMTAFSGTRGPKVREGDGQIPEGIYGIGCLNPNSSYYLSLKVTYPNASNRLRPRLGDFMGTLWSVLHEVVRGRRYDIKVNGEKIHNIAHALVTRMPRIAGGLKIALPPLTDDEYALWFAKDVSRFGCLRIIWNLYRGKPCGVVRILRGRADFSSDASVALEYDDAPHGALPVSVDFAPRRLRILVPTP